MIRTEPILCTIHYIVDWQEHQYEDDQYLPDIQVEGVIKRLLDLLKLQPYLEEPQQGVPTLHTAPDAPALDLSVSLSSAGLVDGSHVWLVITPTNLPATMHWSAGKLAGKLDLVLPARLSVSEHINTFIEILALRERVDGPMQSVVSLHSALDAPALDQNQNLLDLKLRANSQLWFKVEPTFLPVMLHWQDTDGEAAKRLFLAVEKTLGEHLIERSRSIPAAREAINGPEKCVVSLRSTPQGADLPIERKLRDAQIAEEADLWLIWSPTVAEVILHYPEGEREAYKTRRVALPLIRPISEIKREVAREVGLASTNIEFAPSHDGRAWLAQSKLSDHHIRTGDDIWLRVGKPNPLPGPLIAGIVISIVVVVIIGIGAARLFGSAPATQPTTVAEAPTALPMTIPTLTPLVIIATTAPIPTPTRTLDEQKRFDYALGREAYQKQDWEGASKALEHVYTLDPTYLDTTELLAATHYNWAVNILADPSRATEALAILRETFTYAPDHQLAHELEPLLALYIEADMQATNQNWNEAITAFEQLENLNSNFLDVSQRLYNAYIARSNVMRESGDLASAYRDCTLAVNMSNIDISIAQKCVTALEPTPAPTSDSVRLVKVPWVRGADVGRARTVLRDRGFSVAVNEVTNSAEIDGLCNGWVTSSQPAAGTMVPYGSRVRLFYRGFSQPNPPYCG